MTTLETTTLLDEGGTLEQNRFGRLSQREESQLCRGREESGGFVGTELEQGLTGTARVGGGQPADMGIQQGLHDISRE